jgi:hypothetical protein
MKRKWRLVAVAMWLCACARPQGPSAAVAENQSCPIVNPQMPDSVRGAVRVTGSEPNPMVLITPKGGEPILLMGDPTLLRQFQGMEIVAFGVLTRERAESARASGRLRVGRTLVRAPGRELVYDGVLRSDDAGKVLEVCGGERLKLGPWTGRLPLDGTRVVISDIQSPPGSLVVLKSHTP